MSLYANWGLTRTNDQGCQGSKEMTKESEIQEGSEGDADQTDTADYNDDGRCHSRDGLHDVANVLEERRKDTQLGIQKVDMVVRLIDPKAHLLNLGPE